MKSKKETSKPNKEKENRLKQIKKNENGEN